MGNQTENTSIKFFMLAVWAPKNHAGSIFANEEQKKVASWRKLTISQSP